jgi:hypothetical protein
MHNVSMYKEFPIHPLAYSLQLSIEYDNGVHKCLHVF